MHLTGMPDHRLQGRAFLGAQKSKAYHEAAKNRFAAGNPELSRIRRESGYISHIHGPIRKNLRKSMAMKYDSDVRAK